jgi:hypothetical protein
LAGAAYVVVIATGIFAELFVRGHLVVSGDAAQTSSNIAANETRWRLGIVADLVSSVSYVVATLLLYDLLRAVRRSLSLAAAVFGVLGSGIMALNLLNLFAPLVVLGAARYAVTFPTEQLNALAVLPLRVHAVGYNVSAVFFGVHLTLLGYLVFRSTFLPRALGVLLAIAGPCWLANSFAVFLAPTLVARLYPYVLAPGLAEAAFALWLLLVGVSTRKWREQMQAEADPSLLPLERDSSRPDGEDRAVGTKP